jgi:hypothetical protein
MKKTILYGSFFLFKFKGVLLEGAGLRQIYQWHFLEVVSEVLQA